MKTKDIGDYGERIAKKLLKKKGYKILATNRHESHNELDLIVCDSRYIVFVEVKTRTSLAFGSPKEAVTRQKQARYYKIAQYYGLQSGEEPNARFDVIEVFEDGEIVHIENAF